MCISLVEQKLGNMAALLFLLLAFVGVGTPGAKKIIVDDGQMRRIIVDDGQMKRIIVDDGQMRRIIVDDGQM